MKKKKLQSLTLNKKTISTVHMNAIKGKGPTVASDCVSHCLGWECHAHH